MGTNVAHCLKPQIMLLSSPSCRSTTHGTCRGTATASTLTLGGENSSGSSIQCPLTADPHRQEEDGGHVNTSTSALACRKRWLWVSILPSLKYLCCAWFWVTNQSGINLVERNSNKESCPTVLRHFVRFQRASYLVRIWVDLCRGMCTTYWGWRLFLFKCGYQNHRDSGRAHLGHTCTCWSKKCRTSSFIQAQRKELLKNWLYLFWPQKILTNRCRLTRKDLRQLSPSYPRRFWAVYNLLCIK